ncbi:zinc-ribbon domain-containing protein [Rhodobacter calidifons]|uniref:Zinc finger/thioredoxin putative domain-containing protein n=1 Tax=Rhodobacter calidifons TaxID=2715277 RepID=A0ABX0G6A3_9RHOB|nr:zinc-ribbon domain-containing protein [Rhodobacter calidifons]NHB76379.1 hypothetical protein [Rhodobacter calidifons]
MRLVCPNCEAKYEVPEDAIPETGRDVQCANCGHAWYQMRPRAAVAEPAAAPPAAAPVPAAPAPAEPVAAPEPEPAAEPAPAPVAAASAAEALAPVVSEPEPGPAVPAGREEAVRPANTVPAPDLPAPDLSEAVAPAAAPVPHAAPVPEPSVETIEPAAAVRPPEAPATGAGVAEAGDDAETPEPEVPQAAPAAYAVDESVLAILREEAEREAQARRAEAAAPLEMQPDLGIDAAVPAARVAAAPPAAPPAAPSAAPVLPPETADEAADRAAGRRTRLPDVEEINSTLRPSEAPVDDIPEPAALPEAEGRSSFRSGFLLVLTVAILASALYISADALARAVPSLAGVLESYVAFINSLRLQMDGLMQSATVAINGTGG